MSERRSTTRTIQYGLSVDQQAGLHPRGTPHPAVVCLLHGGFSRMHYGREQMAAVAGDLAARGLADCNMEYRRLGALQARWPATMEDVAAGIDHLEELRAAGIDLNLDRVILVGHSVGGQLALWAVGRSGSRSLPPPSVRAGCRRVGADR